MKRVLCLVMVTLGVFGASCGGDDGSSEASQECLGCDDAGSDGATIDGASLDPTTVQSISQECADLAAAGCPGFECVQWRMNVYSEAVDAGCGKKSDAVHACLLQHPASCDGAPPECMVLLNELIACMPSCGGQLLDPGGQSCSFFCEGSISYGATCEPKATGGKTCSCTSGPAAGHSYDFGGPDCTSAAIDHLAWTNCAFAH